MDSLQTSASTSEEIVEDIAEDVAISDSHEEIVVSDDVSAKYAEEIVAYEHGDESQAIKNKLFDYFN